MELQFVKPKARDYSYKVIYIYIYDNNEICPIVCMLCALHLFLKLQVGNKKLAINISYLKRNGIIRSSSSFFLFFFFCVCEVDLINHLSQVQNIITI